MSLQDLLARKINTHAEVIVPTGRGGRLAFVSAIFAKRAKTHSIRIRKA
jgi:hypothetical protein